MKGKLLIFSAPSGSGKSTIVNHLMEKYPSLAFSISACSRLPRGTEIHGKEYYFLSPDEFRKKINEDAFIEWEEVYPGQYYGTLRSEVDRIWEAGHHAVFDIDVVGGLNLKKLYGEQACAIFIEPPSIEVLEERLRIRGTEDEASLQKRLGKAEHEMSYASGFDHVIINRHLTDALEASEIVISRFLQE